MKFLNFVSFALLPVMVLAACGGDEPKPYTGKGENEDSNNKGNTSQTKVEKTPTLLAKTNWKVDTVAPGLIYYNFEANDDVSGSKQVVNVIELDLTNPSYYLEMSYSTTDIPTSQAVKNLSGVAGINGGYELDAIYVRKNKIDLHKVSLAPDHLRFWKHEAALAWSNNEDMGINFGGKNGGDAIKAYKEDTRRNILASAPMLIDNFDPVGTRFVSSIYSEADLVKLDYENPNRHQGVRHPRTAVALTADRDLLLVTVDGRWSGQAEGMSAKELTKFLIKYFNPKDAINMDGGGSTTMIVKGRGTDGTNVVNHPCQTGATFEVPVERKVATHLVIKKK